MKPDIRFTWNDGFAIAYQIVGRGDQDLVYLPGYANNVDLQWDIPIYARFLERLASFSRLIMLDPRGTGCSDRLPPDAPPRIEQTADDVLAVMEAAVSMQATLFAVQEAGFPALLLAASHPDRVARLVLFDASPSWMRSEDLPDEWSPEQWRSHFRSAERLTSATERIKGYVRSAAPSLIDDEVTTRALVSLKFNTQGVGASISETRMLSQIDLRDILPSITVPTLVLQRFGDQMAPTSSSRFLAEHISGAEYLEVAGPDTLPWIGDQEPILEAIERFMEVEKSVPRSNRRLASVLFTDIVDSSARTTALGDAAWSDLVGNHHAVVRQQLAVHGGTEIDTAGDGFFATFEGPTQAVLCAASIVKALAELGLAIRAGVHTGEVERIDDKVVGIAVNIGSRVAATAGPSEVLVSQTVRDIVAGSGLTFEDAGEHELKGVPESWHLYRVVR